jgi:GxxExxY protein
VRRTWAEQIQFERQAEVSVTYKGVRVGRGYADPLIEGRLVVEIKAREALHDRHLAQTLSYLRATGHQLGLLLNFNVAVLRHGIRRVALTP